MSSSSREAAKLEQRVQLCVKQPENKRCINCDSLVRRTWRAGATGLTTRCNCVRPPSEPAGPLACRAPSMLCPTSRSSCAPCAAAFSEWPLPPPPTFHLPLPALPPASMGRLTHPVVLLVPAGFPRRSRQFGHRVKGVSMSTFKAEEVAALEGAGNAVRPPPPPSTQPSIPALTPARPPAIAPLIIPPPPPPPPTTTHTHPCRPAALPVALPVQVGGRRWRRGGGSGGSGGGTTQASGP